MKVLILEDEIPAYHKLLGFIEKEIPDCELLGWARSIKEAKALLQQNVHPDLIFSDIELLDGLSFKVFEDISINCPIIFCTAFDQYLLHAFKSNGIAYLLKPYFEENFKEAYLKYQKLFAKQENTGPTDDMLIQLKEILSNGVQTYKQRFTVKKRDGIKLINVTDIACFEANGDFCIAIDSAGVKYPLNYTMTEIMEKVNPLKFFRINRSQVLNIDYIENINPYFKNRLAVNMPYNKKPYLTSTNKTPAFRKWLEQ